MQPAHRVLLGSYEADFAAGWGRLVRNWFEQNPTLTDVRIKGDSSAADRWETNAGGGMQTAGVGGAFTGKGGNLILLDDILKNWVEAMSPTKRQSIIDWFNSTLYTRAEPNATIIVLMTRWHERDLAGYLQTEHDDDWDVIRLPAIAEDGDALGRTVGEALCPERYTTADLNRIKTAVGSHMFDALYQQRPVPLEGGVWKKNWFQRWRVLPEMDEQIQTWDLSFTDSKDSAFVSGQLLGRKGADVYVIDETHERLDVVGTIAAIRAMTLKHPAARAKLVENKANGAAVIAMLRKEIPGLIAVEPRGDKVTRAMSVAPMVESRNVWIPEDSVMPWAKDYLDEVSSFPNGRYKDRVDALVHGLMRFSARRITGTMTIESLTRTNPLYGVNFGLQDG